MVKKIVLVTLLAIISLLGVPTSTLASDLSADLVSSMDSVCDISIGNNLELLRQAFTKSPYSQQWYPRYKADERMKQHIFYSHMQNNDPEAGYDIAKFLFVDADTNGTINKIRYKMAYRTNGIYYSGMLRALTKNANNNFGLAKDSTGVIDGYSSRHQTWYSGSRKLSIITYQTADKFHPYIIEVVRS
ncbi:MAG: hypothetical protein K0R78_3644 [Pelosinus sp.]|nr:hypothetical protein [Pelosinus sp.]